MPDTSAYKLKAKAALRADRLYSEMGADRQMEDNPRYRENMLGKRERYPLFATAEQPMVKLNQAVALAADVRAANRRKAQEK